MGEAVDRDDDRLREGLDAAGQPLAAAHEFAQRRLGAGGHARREARNVGARAEGAIAGAGENDGAQSALRLHLVQDLLQPVDQRIVQRVQFLGAVERDERHRASPLEQNDILHGATPPLTHTMEAP